MTTWPSPSCSQTDVQNTINANTTVTGDTVQVNGPCTIQWSSFVTIPSSKGITVAGVGNPTISSTSEGFILNAGSSTSRVTGFTCNRAGNVPTDANGHCLQVVTTANSATWRMDHWTLCSGGGSCTTGNTIFVSITGLGPGLIDHNNWQGNGSAWIQYFADGGSGAGWQDNIVPGGPKMLFIEDNTFTNPVCNASSQGCQATNSGGWIQAYNGARNVIRHNTFTMVTIDQHGSQNGGAECTGGTSNCPGAEGVRWYEIYNNDFEGVQGSNPANQNQWFSYMDIRAGAGVIFNNTFNPNGVLAASNQLGVRLREENTCTWPQSYQIGAGIGGFSVSCVPEYAPCSPSLNTAPTHLWGNTGTFNFFNSPVTGNVQQNRDYFLDASQPASIHWKEASTDTCSTTYAYAPFTYPHPLVSGGGGGSPSTIAWNTVHQTMDGFGGQTYTYALNLTDPQADMFFSPTAGIGMAYVRTDNTFDGSIPDLVTLQKAVTRGAQVELTLQSPPCGLKWASVENAETCVNAFADGTASSNGTCFTATQSLATSFAAYSTYIVNYLNNFAANGIPVSILGVQNEANLAGPSSLGSCVWSASAFDTFISTSLGPALAAAGLTPRLKFADESGWPGTGLTTTCLNDAACAKYVSIVSFHGYGNGGIPNTGYCCAPATFVANAVSNGRHAWQGEVNGGLSFNTPANHWNFDPSIADGLVWAQNIHNYWTISNASGWEYWELAYNSLYNAGLTDASFNTTKRFYVVGNWSKFVRPGWVRIDSTTNPQAGVFVTAFKAPDGSKFAIVAINTNGSNTAQTFNLTGFPTITGSAVTPNETSAALNLAAGAPLTVGGGSFSATLDANSVTTFVGTTGPITLLQRVQSDACPTASTTCTVTIAATTVGSALICFVNNLSSNVNGLASCTDGGDTFSSCTALGGPSCRGSFTNGALDMQASLAGLGGKTSITCNLTGANTGPWTCGVYEFATTLSGWAFDGSGNVTDNVAGTTVAGVGLTLSGSNDAIVQAINNSGSVVSIDTGYTLNIDTFHNGEAFLANTTNGTAPTWTGNSSTFTGAGSALAIKTPTSGSPAVTLGSTSIFFGQVDVGGTSPAVPVLVTNTGTGNLILANTYFTISGANVFDFHIVGGVGACAANQTLVPTASCTLYVTFSPQYPSARSASLALFNNAANSPQLIVLTGQGVPQSVGIF